MDPDPDKKYTLAFQINKVSPDSNAPSAQLQSHSSADSDLDSWPKGPYSQQIQGILPPILTDDIILTHLQYSGKQLKHRKQRNVPTNIDFSTLQRGHQYFMEGYIPGKHVMFCLKDGIIWIKARCYHSQKKHDAMHEVKVAITNEYPHHVTRAACSCVAGKAGMCSHVIGLLKQIIHYAMMKNKSVPSDLSCTQMQQSWHKPRPIHIEAEPVMNVTFCKAKQCQTEAKKNPVICSLYEARAHAVQDFNHEQQMNLKQGLIQHKPTCAFAQILPASTITQDLMTSSFGVVPKGSVLSYQSLEYERLDKSKQLTVKALPSLPLGMLENTACVYEINNNEQKLDKLRVILEEAHALEQSTKQQSSSAKWKASRVGKVTASRFGDVLLRCSLPTDPFINSFFEIKDYASLPVQLSHGYHNETKACIIYITNTGFTVDLCGLVVNPSLPWLGASPDGIVHDPSKSSVELLEIKCPYTHRLSAVEDAACDSSFFAELSDGKVTLKKNHKHYYQVQGQMALSKVPWCDFMIYTFKNYAIQRIRFDSEFWDNIQTNLTEFYFKHLLPKAPM